MNEVVIVSAKRSAIGKFGGTLKEVSITDLATQVIKNQIEEININPKDVDELIIGNVLGAGEGQNIARQIALKAGLSLESSAYVLNKVCGSGLKSIINGAQSIILGDQEIIIAGGVEQMTRSSHLIPQYRLGKMLGDQKLIDLMLMDGLTDAFAKQHMGLTAENIATKASISRKEQDLFALESQKKAEKAINRHRFRDEIVPIEYRNSDKEKRYFDTDEYPRRGSSLEKLSKLKPAFKKGGTVTAGNASGINDGAAFVILMSRQRAVELSLPILASISSYAVSGVEPELMGTAPIEATKKALKKANINIEDLDLIESNEAFAVQAINVLNELELNPEIVNVNGGAIALGHPIGASGARILVSLIHEMKKRGSKYGLATLCIGGGQGISMIVKH